MELETRQDLEAPQDKVFAALSDFPMVERKLMQQGVDIRRCAGPEPAGSGTRWHARFKLQGKQREAEVTLERYQPPCEMVFVLSVAGIVARLKIAVEALSEDRSRVVVSCELVAKTLSARLMLQPLKLNRGKVERKVDARVAEYARDLEGRLSRSA